jgi:Pyridoxal phosphate biosynthesis protein
MKTKRIIITAGDPLGIGPQITVKALKKIKAEGARFIVLGEAQSLQKYGWNNSLGTLKEIKSSYKKPSKPCASEYGGDISFKALKTAISMMLKGEGDALVTAPISKEAWAKAGIKFTGHTEVLRRYAKKDGALMMFTDGKINCALVTEHYAIKDLSAQITKERIIKSVKMFAGVLGKKAKIGISALNPHAGDGGKLGFEEIRTIKPAIKKLAADGYKVSGPWPCDALWQKHIKGEFDGIVLMYHDVALLGLKLAAKNTPVHITAGLKFLRVSPVHGTAFDIAAGNDADSSGMEAAIRYAVKKI